MAKVHKENAVKGKKEQELANELVNFMAKPEVSELFNDHEKALNKYFKFYCNLGKAEIGQDLQFRLENLHFKEFSKFSYQSKIVPIIMTADDISSTFRNMVRQF